MSNTLNLKFLLIGSSGVGKTSIVKRLCRNDFDDKMPCTVGIEFMTHTFQIGIHNVKLQIWDTAGQEQYHSVGKNYYRNAVGVLLVYSIDKHNSFEMLEKWYEDVRQYANPHAQMLLVGNKIDLDEQKTVTDEEASRFAEDHNIEYVETSAKTGFGINELFFKMAQTIVDKVSSGEIKLEQETKEPDTSSKSKCKC